MSGEDLPTSGDHGELEDPLRPRRHSPTPDELNALAFVPYDRRWSGAGDGEMPCVAPGIPWLGRILPELWTTIMLELSHGARWAAVDHRRPMYARELSDLWELYWALPPAADVVAAEAMAEGAVGVPVGVMAGRRRSRQVNVRIGVDDHDLLVRAAHIVGTTPTQFARMLILGGMRKVLAEHGRYYALVAAGDD